MKIRILFFIVALMMVVGINTSEGKDSRNHDDSNHEFYGSIEKIPANRIGIWIIGGREVNITQDTFINEEHGKVEVGAYVELEGTTSSGSFTATKIEVKARR